MEISPAVLVLITTGSALLGVIVTSIFNLLTTRITKESEERKHQKELVFNAALENWKQTIELIKADRIHATQLAPLDSFLIHMVALSDLLFDPTLTPDNLKDRMPKIHDLTRAMESLARDPRKEMEERDS